MLESIKKRLQKLERFNSHIAQKVIRVIQREDQSMDEAITLAGYPLEEENRLVIIRAICSKSNPLFLCPSNYRKNV